MFDKARTSATRPAFAICVVSIRDWPFNTEKYSDFGARNKRKAFSLRLGNPRPAKHDNTFPWNPFYFLTGLLSDGHPQSSPEHARRRTRMAADLFSYHLFHLHWLFHLHRPHGGIARDRCRHRPSRQSRGLRQEPWRRARDGRRVSRNGWFM